MGFNSVFKGLNVNGDNLEVWCVPSVTHVSWTHGSYDEIGGKRVFVTRFSETCRSHTDVVSI